ncbi:TRAP transporter large permease subunit [Chloroflexota bacterium]
MDLEWYIVGSVLLGGLIFLLAMGVPIAFSLGFMALTGFFFFEGGESALAALTHTAYGYLRSFIFIALPLFIFMAEILLFTGVSQDLFDTLHKWSGRIPGSIAVASVGTCAGFAAMCGSSAATAATIGLVALPEMEKRGYDMELGTGSIAAGGALGILIPPSIIMIVFGMITETSIGHLFLAGFIPGIMLALMMMTYITLRCIKNPSLAPPSPSVPWKEKIFSLRKVWASVLLIFLVLGGIYLGVATPTEAAGVGAFGSLCLALTYRKLTWQNLRQAMMRTVRVMGFFGLIIAAAISYSHLLIYVGVSDHINEMILSLEVSRWIILIVAQLTFILMGCFLDPAGIILITMPVLFPVFQELGFDGVWLGVLMVINMEVANITPPVGFNLFIVKGISPPTVTMGDIIRGSFPFVLLYTAGIGIIMAFPQIALWLPGTMR